jgi:phage shock protein A
MVNNDNNVYINTNTNAYLDFKRQRDQKKSLEKRIDSLEKQVKEMIEKMQVLEAKANNREAT